MTLDETQLMYPFMNWTDYLNQIFQSIVSVDANKTVTFISFPYFENLNKILHITSKRTISNYLIWRATDTFTKPLIRESDSPRWEECVRLTKKQLPMAAGALYIRKYFKDDTKHKVTQMVDQIRKEFRVMLNQNEWMDKKTKLAANQKFDTLDLHIGYVEELKDDKKLAAYYEPLEINRTDYLASILNLNQFYWINELKSLRKSVNRTDWAQHMPLLNTAYYDRVFNSFG